MLIDDLIAKLQLAKSRGVEKVLCNTLEHGPFQFEVIIPARTQEEYDLDNPNDAGAEGSIDTYMYNGELIVQLQPIHSSSEEKHF